MAEVNKAPWLTLLGWGESGTAGLTAASREQLERTEISVRHQPPFAPSSPLNADIREWPVPFLDGIPALLNEHGRRVVMLVSGDPFWFGAGTSVARHLEASEWIAVPSPSTFSLAAARLGWPLERCTCLGPSRQTAYPHSTLPAKRQALAGAVTRWCRCS